MTGLGWVLLATLAVLFGGILATIHRAELYITGRPRRYRARHRRRWLPRMHTPGPAHPAWLNMRPVDDAEVQADMVRVWAAVDDILDGQSR